jgi:hypothetical protein
VRRLEQRGAAAFAFMAAAVVATLLVPFGNIYPRRATSLFARP